MYCIQSVTWGKHGATCPAHSFLSVLTWFPNKKVVHSIKSVSMLQEMAAESSAFWSALETPLHGWHFSSIFPRAHLACPVRCSACPFVQQMEFPCAAGAWSAGSYLFPKGGQKLCRGQEGLAQLGSLLQPLGSTPGFPSGRSRAGSCCGHPFNSSTANCSRL